MESKVEKLLSEARLFIDANPHIRTASFSLTREEYTEFTFLELGRYKVISDNLDLDTNRHNIVLSKDKYNWLLQK